MRSVAFLVASLASAVTVVGVAGPAWAVEDQVSSIDSVDWSTQDVLDRCRGVVQDATADYEQITATAVAAGSSIRVDMHSANAFPKAELAAKVCVWSDTDRDGRIDPAEEGSVRASYGPLRWAEGTRDAALTVTDPQLAAPTCMRVWMNAFYPDGATSTKRSSITCVAAAPPNVVPEVPFAVALSAGGGALLAGLTFWRSRGRGRVAA